MFPQSYHREQRVSSYMAGVYGWMSCGLAVTAGTSYYVANTPAIFTYLYTHQAIVTGLMFAQLALVCAITFLLNRISFATALVLFIVYAGLLGITLSSIFYVYTEGSIITTFLTTAGTFGAMSLYGYTTKADLTSVGSMSFMVLIGLMIGMLVNRFLQSEQFDYVLSGVGVILFVLLTAYDTQKIKQIIRVVDEEEMLNKVTLLGALTLYLDFINLFLFLLRFMGNRRQK
jgi:uncharacterized protein